MPIDNPDNEAKQGFPAVSARDARILVLGSLPGRRSLDARQYYAHPQNAFWRIMRELIGAEGSYAGRCGALVDNGIALWDVLAASVRPGSMDADIRLDTAKPNDFNSFLRSHPGISRICFNGRRAAEMFDRLVVLDAALAGRELWVLPSTSPAYASMRFEEKLVHWRAALDLQTRG